MNRPHRAVPGIASDRNQHFVNRHEHVHGQQPGRRGGIDQHKAVIVTKAGLQGLFQKPARRAPPSLMNSNSESRGPAGAMDNCALPVAARRATAPARAHLVHATMHWITRAVTQLALRVEVERRHPRPASASRGQGSAWSCLAHPPFWFITAIRRISLPSCRQSSSQVICQNQNLR